MDYLVVFTLLIGNGALIIPLFIWSRGEARTDSRSMEAKVEAYMLASRQEIRAIHEEIKDFHGRLCAIEERNRK